MHYRTNALVLLVLAISLLLRADSCTTETRAVRAVAGTTLEFTVIGSGRSSAWTDTLDAGARLRGVLDRMQDVQNVDSVRVVGARMEFTRNEGFSAIRLGNVLMGESGATQRILEFRAADSQAGTSGNASFTSVNQPPAAGEIRVNWKTAGVRNLHASADSFLARYLRGDAAELRLAVLANWTPAAPDTLPDDFDLLIRLDLQVSRRSDVEVYTF